MSREMKDSGVEWIGEIPSSWNVVRNKDIFRERKERATSKDNFELLAVSEYYGVAKKKDKVDEGDFLTRAESLDGYKICCKNDLAMNIMLAWKKAYGVSAYDGIVSPSYSVFQCLNIHPKYYHFLMRTEYYANLFKQFSTGIIDSRLRLYPNIFLSLKSHNPPIIEQIKISEILENKVKEIDNILSKTKSTIEDYKRLKQSIITEAVTKGLDKNVEMKDSGIEWIGEIPLKWSVTKLKNEVYLRARLGWKGLKADEYVDEGIIFLATPNIKENTIDFTNVNYITRERYDESPEIKVSVGDVLLTKDGSTLGTLNIVRHLPGEVTINGSIALLSPSEKINSIYLYYYLKSSYIQNLIMLKKGGMGVPHLFQRDIKEFPILLPEIEVQETIASYLDDKCEELEKLIRMKQELLIYLENYKKSLIYEYVTGKKEVE